ncbi:MAG: MBL fold metallo-hydrolase, partial [Chitinivibrionales bacterium]|nr:MBL fold metallo-hydrolase [Chitinivibrionales bacterium]
YSSFVNYTYLVIDPASNRAVIVDPAWRMDKIELALTNSKAVLDAVLITHAHPDHVHLARPLATAHNCPILMSKEEIEVSGYGARQLIGIDGAPWTVGDMHVRPIFTPGHSAGSVCYLIHESVFTGDTLFSEGCGLCSDTESAYAMFASLERLKKEVMPHIRVYPGHSYGTPPGMEFGQIMRKNMYLSFKSKEDFAAYRLRKQQAYSKYFKFA